MSGYELLLLLPPVLALAAAWFSARAVRKSAADIDRKEARLRSRRKADDFEPPYIRTR